MTSLGEMAYTTAEARPGTARRVRRGHRADRVALAALGAAYDQLDEHNADRLEAELFRPIQAAYGRAKGAHGQFADRHGLARRSFETPAPGLPSIGPKGFIDSAADAATEADGVLSSLQDSMLPAEVGDVESRAAIADVRDKLGGVRQRARSSSERSGGRRSPRCFEG